MYEKEMKAIRALPEYKNFTRVIRNRGRIIDLAITVEEILTDVIAWCMYPGKYIKGTQSYYEFDQKGMELKLIILDKINFRDKTDIFKQLIEIEELEIWKNQKELVKEIIEGLNKSRTLRNKYAHCKYNYQKTNNIQLVEIKKGKIHIEELDNEKIKNELYSMLKTQTRLLQLWAFLVDDVQEIKKYDKNISAFRDLLKIP